MVIVEGVSIVIWVLRYRTGGKAYNKSAAATDTPGDIRGEARQKRVETCLQDRPSFYLRMHKHTKLTPWKVPRRV